MFQDINLLILDEPTNHLDIDSIETLEAALEDFKGTIFFISHDRYFINKIGERVIAIEDHGFKSYDGNYDFYKGEKEKVAVVEEPVVVKGKPERSRPENVEDKKVEAEKAKALTKIESLEKEIFELDLVMALNPMDYEQLNELYGKKQDLSTELDLAMELWMGYGE